VILTPPLNQSTGPQTFRELHDQTHLISTSRRAIRTRSVSSNSLRQKQKGPRAIYFTLATGQRIPSPSRPQSSTHPDIQGELHDQAHLSTLAAAIAFSSVSARLPYRKSRGPSQKSEPIYFTLATVNMIALAAGRPAPPSRPLRRDRQQRGSTVLQYFSCLIDPRGLHGHRESVST